MFGYLLGGPDSKSVDRRRFESRAMFPLRSSMASLDREHPIVVGGILQVRVIAG